MRSDTPVVASATRANHRGRAGRTRERAECRHQRDGAQRVVDGVVVRVGKCRVRRNANRVEGRGCVGFRFEQLSALVDIGRDIERLQARRECGVVRPHEHDAEHLR